MRRVALLCALLAIVLTQGGSTVITLLGSGNSTSADPGDIPLEVINLTAVNGDTRVDLDWDDSQATNHDHWQLDVNSAFPGGAWVAETDPAVSNAAVTGLTNGSGYAFRVRDCNLSESECSLYAIVFGNPFAPPVGGSGSYKDNFTRTGGDSTDISDGAPDPPGSYYETQAFFACDAEIVSGELQFSMDSTDCRNSYVYIYGQEDLGSANQWIAFEISDSTNWIGNRGPRGLFRWDGVDDGSGNHYEVRCTTPDCVALRPETVSDVGGFVDSHANNADCDNELPAFTDGDYIGMGVEGTGNETVFYAWHFAAASLPSDLEDADTWGPPECTIPVNGSGTYVDDGNFVGIGALGSFDTNPGDTLTVDNFSATSTGPIPVGSGPNRTNPVPTTTQAVGTTNVNIEIDTSVNADCEYNTVGSLDYGDPLSTAFTTGQGTQEHLTNVTGLSDGTTFDYYIRCQDTTTLEPNPDDFLLQVTVDAPLGVVNLVANPGDTSVGLGWNDSLNTLDHDHWKVEWKLTSDPDIPGSWNDNGDASSSSATVTSLTNGVSHDFRVADCDLAEASCSAWVTETTTPEVNSGACTDGVDCFCDRVNDSGDSIYDANTIFCEDFEDPSLEDRTVDPGAQGSSGWFLKYPGQVGECFSQATYGSWVVEGPEAEFCVNVVQPGACDNPDPDCVHDGNASAGFKFRPGRGGGFMGTALFSENTTTFGATIIKKYSTNFVDVGFPIKTDEFSRSGGKAAHCFFGCNTTNLANITDPEPNNPLSTVNPGSMAIGTSLACAENASCYGTGSGGTIGRKCNDYPANTSCSASMHFTPEPTTWDTGDWPLGDWACLQFHIAGWGTSNGTIRFWRNGVLQGTRTGVNLTDMRDGENSIGQLAWNNYYNGAGTPQGYDPGLEKAYTYEDNVHVTKGPEPISCAAAGWTP